MVLRLIVLLFYVFGYSGVQSLRFIVCMVQRLGFYGLSFIDFKFQGLESDSLQFRIYGLCFCVYDFGYSGFMVLSLMFRLEDVGFTVQDFMVYGL